jgi:hypothetical protein
MTRIRKGLTLRPFAFSISASSQYFPSNTMLLSILFATIVLIINNHYSTFASLIASNGSVTTGQPLNTHVLAKCIPPDQRCATAAQWRKRICKPVMGDRIWEEQCTGPDLSEVIRYIYELCPENTMCANVIRSYGDSIVCNDHPAVENNPGVNQQAGVVQIGGL